MKLNRSIDQMITDIHGLDRAGCIAELGAVEVPRLDFTEDYLEELTLDQLRHILMAACIQAKRSGEPGESNRRAS